MVARWADCETIREREREGVGERESEREQGGVSDTSESLGVGLPNFPGRKSYLE